MSLVVFGVLYVVLYLFVLVEHTEIVRVSCTLWQHHKLQLLFKLKHVLEQTHEFYFTLVRLASYLTEV